MSDQNRYDPEDLEQLLMTKSFSELLPEEKAFVLQHVENDLEYDTMRETYSVLNSLPELDPDIIPSPKTKAKLMAEFDSDDEAALIVLTPWQKFSNWLWDTNKSFIQRPAFQLTGIAAIFFLGYFIVTFNPNGSTLAEHREKAPVETPKTEKTSPQEIKPEIKKEVKPSEDSFKKLTPSAEEIKPAEVDEVSTKIQDDLVADLIVSDSDNSTVFPLNADRAVSFDSYNYTSTSSESITAFSNIEAVIPEEVLAGEANFESDSPESLDIAEKEEEDLADEISEVHIETEKSLSDNKEIEVAEDMALDYISDDYLRESTGNSVFKDSELNEITTAATSRADDRAEELYANYNESVEVQAYSASNFSSLLSVLHTAK